MKRVLKLSSCNVLTIYAKKYPINLWDDFYYYNKSKLYKRLKKQIFQKQGGLCAYCESEIKLIHHQRVEHIHDKSDYNKDIKNSHNWHLDSSNLVGVCLGGSSPKNSLYPTPENLSCDAYKDNQGISYQDILNPLEIQIFPNLFKLEKKTGKLEANDEKCKEANIDSTLVENTIINLNLNCDRLVTDRYNIFIAYNREIEKGRKLKDREIHKKLAYKWFSQKYPSFFTTRRILLGKDAEEYLKRNNYDG